MHSSLKTSLIHDPAAFQKLQPEWEALLSRSTSACLYLTPEYLAANWTYFGRNSQLWLITVRDQGNRLVGIAPLALCGAGWIRWHVCA